VISRGPRPEKEGLTEGAGVLEEGSRAVNAILKGGRGGLLCLESQGFNAAGYFIFTGAASPVDGNIVLRRRIRQPRTKTIDYNSRGQRWFREFLSADIVRGRKGDVIRTGGKIWGLPRGKFQDRSYSRGA